MIGTPEAPRGKGDWNMSPLEKAGGNPPGSRLDRKLGRSPRSGVTVFLLSPEAGLIPLTVEPITPLGVSPPQEALPEKPSIYSQPVGLSDFASWLRKLPEHTRQIVTQSAQAATNLLNTLKTVPAQLQEEAFYGGKLLELAAEKAHQAPKQATTTLFEAAKQVKPVKIVTGARHLATDFIRSERGGEFTLKGATEIGLPALVAISAACSPRPATPPPWVTPEPPRTPVAGEVTTAPTSSKGEVAATPTVRQQVMLYSDKGVIEVTPDLQSAMVKYNTDQVNRKLTPYMESNSDFVPDYKTDATGRTYKDYSNYSLLAFDRAGEGNQLIGGAFFIAKGQLFYALSPDRRTATITVPDNTPLFFWDPSSPDRHFRIEIPSGMTNLVIRYDGPKNQLIYDFLKDNQPTQVIVPLTGDPERIGKFSLPPTPPPPTVAPTPTPTESPIIVATRQSEAAIKAAAISHGINPEKTVIRSFDDGETVVSIMQSQEDKTRAWYLDQGNWVEVKAYAGADHFQWDFKANSIAAMTNKEGKEFTLYWRNMDGSWNPWWIEKPGGGREIAHFADGFGLPYFVKSIDHWDPQFNPLLQQAKSSPGWLPERIAAAIAVPPDTNVSPDAYNRWRAELKIDTSRNDLVNKALDRIASFPPDLRAAVMTAVKEIKLGGANTVDSLTRRVYLDSSNFNFSEQENIGLIIMNIVHEGGTHLLQSEFVGDYKPYQTYFKIKSTAKRDWEFEAHANNVRVIQLYGRLSKGTVDYYTNFFVNTNYPEK